MVANFRGHHGKPAVAALLGKQGELWELQVATAGDQPMLSRQDRLWGLEPGCVSLPGGGGMERVSLGWQGELRLQDNHRPWK